MRAFPWKVPARTPRQFAQAQFHCGNPPPAAEPRIFTRILRVYNGGRDGTYGVRASGFGLLASGFGKAHEKIRRSLKPESRSPSSESIHVAERAGSSPARIAARTARAA